jgi:uncharacterized protein
MSLAWLLDMQHRVTLYEAEPALGGHIRTLNGNVPCPGIPADWRIDCGVIEFPRDRFPAFAALLAALEIEVAPIAGGSTGLYFPDGRHYLSPAGIAAAHADLLDRAHEMAHLVPLAVRRRRFLHRARTASAEALVDAPVSAFLDDSDFSVWLKSLLTYAYSADYDTVDNMPAALAVPMLSRFLEPTEWVRIPGGVYRYIERIRETVDARIVVRLAVKGVHRGRRCTVELEDGSSEEFDHVVFATSPDRILPLLGDQSDDERRRLGAWEGGLVHTWVHTDVDLARRSGIERYSEFDLIVSPQGDHGYNAYLNRLCGLPEQDPHVFLALHLDREIAPDRVLHRQGHHVPHYTVAALRWREELRAHNGERGTWYAGAWLGDGLHEGAIRSAMDVVARLGGRQLGGPWTT